MKLRKTAGGVVAALVALGSFIPAAAPSFAAPARSATPAAYDVEQCMPSAGTGNVSPNGPALPQPKDNNANVYAGGNFTRLSGSELEGQLVVNGNADFTSGGYSAGYVGAGSGMMPVAGSDVIRVGGNLNFTGSANFQSAIIDGSGNFLESHVKIGGLQQGDGTISTPGSGSSIADELGREAALGSPSFSEWPSNDFQVLKDLAAENVNNTENVAGTSNLQWGTLRLDGDASATRHEFTLNAADLTAFSLQVGDNIDPTEPIIITVTGDSPVVDIQGLYDADMKIIDTAGERFGQLASQILWVFPDATDVRLDGGQLPGSVIVPTAGSTTTMAAAGSNGRIWVAGDLVQDRAGSEFHNYPFIGDPGTTCNEPPTPDAGTVDEFTPQMPAVEQATCREDGTATDPTVTLAETEGVTYKIDGEIKAGSTITVTATAKDAATLKEAEGWELSEDLKTATTTIELTVPDCQTPAEPVAPVLPDVTQAQCTEDGTATDPVVTLAQTEGITYTIDGEVKAGNTISVTATPGEGVTLAEAEGWTLNEDGSATTGIILEKVDCTPETEVALPVLPSVDQGQCVDGEAVDPVVNLASTVGISYKIEGEVKAGNTVKVIATALESFDLGESDGWTLNEDGTATTEVVLSNIDCTPAPLLVDPVLPDVLQAQCNADGTVRDPKVTVAVTEGIEYTIKGEVKAGSTVTVTATPKDGYELEKHAEWTMNADGTATAEITLDQADCDPDVPTVATPIAPSVEQAKCTEDDQIIRPRVVPTKVEGVDYTIVGEFEPGKTVEIIASPADGFTLGEAEGWTSNGDGTATYIVELSLVDCTPDAQEPILPVLPDVTQAKCAQGEAVDPSIEFANTPGVSYSVKGEVKAGNTVTVIATPDEGITLAESNGWTLNEDGTASTEVELSNVDCTSDYAEVSPVLPTVDQAQCLEDGTASEPKITLAETEGIDYSIDGEVKAGSTVKVVATPTTDVKLVESNGWTVNEDGTATAEIVLSEVDCETTPPVEDKEVAPAPVLVVQATCNEDGTVTDPTVVPGETPGVEYTIDGEVKAGNTVKVIATPEDGVKLTAADGWTLNEDGTATYEVVLEEADCETTPPVEDAEVVPVNPVVEQAVCTDQGTVDGPSVTVESAEGISYEIVGDVKAGETIKVVATPERGFKLVETKGWTLNEDGTSTFEIVLDDPECENPPVENGEVTPQAPVVEQAICTEDGTVTGPKLTLKGTEGINYSVEGEVEAGATIKVIATPEDGNKLIEAEGWTLNEDGTATYEITFSTPDCETTPPLEDKDVAPVAPVVQQPKCVEGDVVAPKLELPETEGVKYTVDGEVKEGNTVKVTAAPEDGNKLIEAEGWTLNEDGTATFTVTFDEAEDCSTAPEPTGKDVAPVAPVVQQPKCVEGDRVDPKLELPETEGVKYTVDGEIKEGNTVKVTATPEDGFKLTEADGWTLNEDGTATFTVTFDKVTQCPTTEEPTENPKETPAPDTKDPETKAPEAKDKDSLADTGLASLPFVVVGLGLVAAGALIVAKRRKKA